jgi:hypothetical protein
MFWPESQGHFSSAIGRATVGQRSGKGKSLPTVKTKLRGDLLKECGEEVHAGTAYEAGDEFVGRICVEQPRRGDLLHLAAAHHNDSVGERHGLDLIVRHINRRRVHRLVNPLDGGGGRCDCNPCGSALCLHGTLLRRGPDGGCEQMNELAFASRLCLTPILRWGLKDGRPMSEPQDFTGKVVVVTGAASGQGKLRPRCSRDAARKSLSATSTLRVRSKPQRMLPVQQSAST